MPSPIAKLVVVSGERAGTTLEISRPLEIGSHRQSDLHLRDAAVSWKHARVSPEGGELFVEDLGSASGTLLNGSPVRRARLRAGDTIAVGSSRILVSLEDQGGQGGPTDGLRDAILRDVEESRRGLAESQKEIVQLREELARTRAALEAAEARASASEKRSAEVGRKARESADRRGKLLRELEDARRREAEVAREASESRSAIRDLRDDLARRDEELVALRDERRRLEAARQEGEAALRSEEERSRELSRSLEAKGAEVGELRRAGEAASRDAEALRRELDIARQGLEAGRQELEAGRRDLEAVRRDLEAVRRDLEVGHRDLEACRREMEGVRARLESATVERESLRVERDLLRAELARAAESREGIERVLAEARTAADAYRGESLQELAEAHRQAAALEFRLELASRDLDAERTRGGSLASQLAEARGEADSLRRAAEESGEQARSYAREAELLKARVDAGIAALDDERSRRDGDRAEIAALRQTLLESEERAAEAARGVEAANLRLAAAHEAVEREKAVAARLREEASAIEERLARSDEKAAGLRDDILSLERHRLAVEAEREGLRRLVGDLEAQREELEKANARISEELRRALDLREREGHRRRELEEEKASLEGRLLHAVEGTTRLEGEASSLRALVEAERERFRAQREDDSRSHRSELESALARDRSRFEEIEREAGERIARFEARILDLSGERDALLARVGAAELRSGEIEAALSRERATQSERMRREAEQEARIADLEAARGALAAERDHLAGRVGDLQKALEDRDAELSREREDIAWKNGELDRIRQALRDADREHTAEVVDLRAREGAVSEDLAARRSDLDELGERHEKVLLEIEALRGERTRSATEISLLRGYLEELKEKVREKDRQVLAGRDDLRREAAAQTARLIQEKRKLEILVRELREGRSGAGDGE